MADEKQNSEIVADERDNERENEKENERENQRDDSLLNELKEIERVEENVKQKMEGIQSDFTFYGTLCLAFGIFYTFCRYKNPNGITYPLFVTAEYVIAYLVLKRSGSRLKKGSWFLAGVSVLLAVSTCRTENFVIFWLNQWALLLLGAVFVLHQSYEDRSWNIGKYMASICIYLFRALGSIGYPFDHLFRFFRNAKDKRFKNAGLVCMGLVFGIPMMFLMAGLLAAADEVFDQLFKNFLVSFLRPWTLFRIILMALGSAVIMYSLICAAKIKNISADVKDRRNQNPVMAVSFLGIISVMYLAFSLVQIIYLFMGKGELPAGVTYSSYARKGFFQLLAVAVINLIMVLCSLKYFMKSRVMNGVLTVICICTYIMIASAAYRMILYVGEYQLTFLRVFVLWFLALLAVMMTGVVAIIFKNDFPLFRYCLAVVSVFYLGFAWARPDYGIAAYNVAHMTAENEHETIKYLVRNLSEDAAPIVAQLEGEYAEKQKEEYFYEISLRGKNMSFRTYNFSLARALKY